MEPMTISQVSKILGISTRMLRYYEKAGLIETEQRYREQGGKSSLLFKIKML